jgi:hypothetical protein
LRLSDLIVALDLVSRRDADEALDRQARTGRKLAAVLVELGMLTEHQVSELENGLPYKIHVHGPTPEEFAVIMRSACEAQGVSCSNEAIAHTINAIQQHGTPLAYYQAIEIPQQIADYCGFLKQSPIANEHTISFPLGNILVS